VCGSSAGDEIGEQLGLYDVGDRFDKGSLEQIRE